MRKPLLGVLVGAVVYFVWGALSWTVVPWHNHVVRTLPEEQLITDTLKTVIPASGFFLFPSMEQNGKMMDAAAFAERYQKGPTGVVVFSTGGRDWMGPGKYIVAFLGALGIAAVSMLVLCVSRDRVSATLPRILLVMLLGVAVFCAPHLSYWNWFSFPSDFTSIAAADSLVSFFILGLAQVLFVPKS